VAIDPKHLSEDPKVLQQMVPDLMTQLDREFRERNKIESLLRELLDAKRNRKSEQLSADQLALFAAACQVRRAAAEGADTTEGPGDDDQNVKPGASDGTHKREQRPAVASAAPQARAPHARFGGFRKALPGL
jgi:hypothetical protein